VAIGVVIIVVVKKSKQREKDAEELKNSSAYELALKIKDELEKKGYKVSTSSDPVFTDNGAYGSWIIYSGNNHNDVGFIYFSTYIGCVSDYHIRMKIASGIRIYAIKSDNIGIIVVSDKEQSLVEMAAEVIKNNGYSCTHY